MYTQAKYTVVCFESANSLNAVMKTTPVLRGENFSFKKPFCRPFSDMNKCRLATIYVKCLTLIVHSIAFVSVNSGSSLEIKPILPDMSDVEKRFVVLESSLASLVEQIGKLVKRLDSFMSAVSQPSPECQLPNWVSDVVMEEDLSEVISGKTATTLDFFVSPEVKRLENMLEGLSASCIFQTSFSMTSLVWKIAMCNVRSINNFVKQDDVICWHKEMNNLISIIMNKFDGVQVFTSGLDSGYLGSGVVIIMNNSLARHVCKNNLSVLILEFYAGALLVVWFSQADKINSLIAKACASFKKCFDLGLTNSHGVAKALDYIFVSLSLVNAVIDGSVANVENYFNTNHKAVFASMGLGGLLNIHLSLISNAIMFLDKFEIAKKFSDLDAMWNIVYKVMIFLANDTFKKKWFKGYDGVFTKESSKLHKLEILVLKIVKASCEIDSNSVLECSFRKVALDHLVSDNDLILDPVEVKNKKAVLKSVPDLWQHQYLPLGYVNNNAFFSVINAISLNDLTHVIKNLPDSKAVSMIPKPYKWESVLTNTRPITLIETAHKIFSKLLSDRVLLVCSLLNVLCGDNFSVLKDTTTQSPIFAIGLVVKDTLEKNCELWLVLQDMCKAYDSMSWHHLYNSLVQIKMCRCFIRFFGSIHNNCIFYDPLLCKIKKQKSLCGYQINTKFVAKTDKIEDSLTLFLAAGAFAAIQYILDTVSEFFRVNDISINNEKTDLSKPSLAKTHMNIKFFVNLFLYLVLAVLQPIVSYRTQFSFVSKNVYAKWNTLIRKRLRLKAGLLKNFPNEALHYSSLYGLKSFKQLQTECKVTFVLCFSNAGGVFGRLFNHRSLDLQVLSWSSIYFLCHLIRLRISLVNNFLAGVIKIFLDYNMSFNNLSVFAFRFSGGTLIFTVLGASLFYNVSSSLKKFGKRLDPKGSVFCWFILIYDFLDQFSISDDLHIEDLWTMNVCSLDAVFRLGQCLSSVNMEVVSVYTNGSLRDLGLCKMKYSATAYFSDLDLSISAKVGGLVSSTMAELQTIALALECVSLGSSIMVYSDSQTALDVCVVESALVFSDFHNCYWMERHGIINLIKRKQLDVSWHKDIGIENLRIVYQKSIFVKITGHYAEKKIRQNCDSGRLQGRQQLNLCLLYKRLHNKTFRSTKSSDKTTFSKIPTPIISIEHQVTENQHQQQPCRKVADQEKTRENYLGFSDKFQTLLSYKETYLIPTVLINQKNPPDSPKSEYWNVVTIYFHESESELNPNSNSANDNNNSNATNDSNDSNSADDNNDSNSANDNNDSNFANDNDDSNSVNDNNNSNSTNNNDDSNSTNNKFKLYFKHQTIYHASRSYNRTGIN
ncbi:hypothetical protein G9A89_016582 [Geosiphon pyriformis]|nr:hypothetical protein G9A89_016582 [Geosiphon pyriformis]